jgi:hypothetical protein
VERLLARDHWTIENREHYHYERTQDEVRCLVRNPRAAAVQLLFRARVTHFVERQTLRSSGFLCAIYADMPVRLFQDLRT